MAGQETTETVTMDDKELFQSAVADEPKQETPAQDTPASDEGQPRDEHGRFAAKSGDEPAKAKEQPAQPATETPEQAQLSTEPKDDQAAVPPWRLRELREARETAERRAEEASRQSYALQHQLQQMQRELAELRRPKQEPIDFFTNPDEALQQRLSPLQTDLDAFKNQMRLDWSRELAAVKHGEAAVNEMEQAIEQAMRQNHPDMPSLGARMRSSNNPTAVAMQWFQQQKVTQTVGNDPEAWFEKQLEERLKDQTYQGKLLERMRGAAQPTNGSRPAVQLPPSLNKATGSGTNAGSADDNDMSDAGLFRYATAPGRR